MKEEAKILALIAELYGKDSIEPFFSKLVKLVGRYKNSIMKQRGFALDQKSTILITYGDTLKNGQKDPLCVLKEFSDKHLSDLIEGIHILPFFPYSSDDGFSVIDYRAVDPKLGTWEDIAALSQSFALVFDAVINHVSVQNPWFQGYLNGDEKYRDYFIEVNPSADISKVVRPRNLSLLTTFKTKKWGQKHLWTTFSDDQIDLNYTSLALFLEIIDILLLYVQKGASMIRLDAIAFLWKELSTNCINLPQTHIVIKLIRLFFEEVAPWVHILTETNVPHDQNVSYFGANDEAHLVYQFSLPPLVAHGILRERADILSHWVNSLEEPASKSTFFNFLASHDGIGVRPAKGILKSEEIDYLVQQTLTKGGNVSYKGNSDGSKNPYELNINYYSLLCESDEQLSVRKFLLAQSILLSMPGICGIYIHSLLGSENFTDGVKQTGRFRTINREKIDISKLEKELTDPYHRRYSIFQSYAKMLKIRQSHKAFHPKSGFFVLNLHRSIFALSRGGTQDRDLILLHNFSSKRIEVKIEKSYFKNCREDLLTKRIYTEGELVIEPYEFLWLLETTQSRT